MINLTINGQPVEVPLGTTVLKACRSAGVDIPTLCDHPSIKPYGGCRLCVVEVQGMRTLQASCTLPVFNGMVVQTDTPKVRKARQFVLEMLFSERNHFCMYCQKSGGDCELQNAAYGEDMTHWPIQPTWKPYLVDASHPYYVFDHNRCILCRRCVRACGEMVGNFTLNLENRGARTVVIADSGVPMGESTCIKCGTCVQICPTGALIDRNSAYLGLEKDSEIVGSVCVGCSVGCSIEMHVRDNQLFRIDGAWSGPVNEGLLCERGRYLSLPDGEERIEQPLMRKDNVLVPVSWEEATQAVAGRLAPLAGMNGSGVAALASTRLDAESLHVFRQIFKDHLAGSMVASIEEDFVTAGLPDGAPLGDLQDLKQADCVVAIGADIFESHRVMGFFVKRNLPLGTCLVVIDPAENSMSDRAAYNLRLAQGSDETLLKGLMSAILQLGLDRGDLPQGASLSMPDPAAYPLAAVSQATGIPSETLAQVAREIAAADHPVFVFGKGLTGGESGSRQDAALDALVRLAILSGAKLISPRGKANSTTAQAYGLDGRFLPAGHQAVYLALGDDEPSERLMQELAQAPFLVVQASYRSAATDQADIVLPVGIWAEQPGYYANLEGRVQQAKQSLQAPGEARSNLAALQELARCLGVQLRSTWEEDLTGHTIAVAA